MFPFFIIQSKITVLLLLQLWNKSALVCSMEEKAKALIEEKLILYQTSVISLTFRSVRTCSVKEYIDPQHVQIH